MQKIIKIDNKVIAFCSNGSSYERNDLTEEQFNKLMEATTDEEIAAIMNPDFKKQLEEYKATKGTIDNVKKSKLLIKKGDAVYWEEISMLSMPKELVDAVLDAESKKDEVRIETYRNFWTLMSLNPDEQCRLNLFWFLNRNGLVISRCGFFVAYRNVCKTKEEGVFTDNYSRTFKIKIGEMVTMPREQCDDNQNVTCSKGLHLGARSWLRADYFGDVGLVCLCNPAEVVAVPHEDNYGKLRTCAYLPIDFAEFDSNGDVIPYDAKDGFECDYVPGVIYEGLMGTEEDSNYRIVIPDIPGINKKSITEQLLDLAMRTISSREVL